MKELILTFSVFCGGIFAQCGSLGLNPATPVSECAGSGTARASTFTFHQSGSRTALTGTGLRLQTTYPSIFGLAQNGPGFPGNPYITAISPVSQAQSYAPAAPDGPNAASRLRLPGADMGRTFVYPFTGACQGAISGFNIQLPNTNAVTLNSCGSTTQPEWSIAAGVTCPTLTTSGCQWWWETIPQLPAANPNLTAYLQFRSVDSAGTHSVTLQIAYACMTVGSVPDAPSYTNLTSVVLTPSATSNALVQTSVPLSPIACPAGDDLRIQFYPTANTLTSPLALSRSNIVLQGGTY